MVALRDIQNLSRAVVKEFHPRSVLLFGSHAHGTAGADSDVDLLVVMPHEGRPVDKSVEIRMKVRPRFPVDILVRSPEKVRERLAMGDRFMRDIVEHGKVLYETDDAGVDREGRR